jgi:hypothetical protein
MRSRDPNTAAHPPKPKPIVDVPGLHQAAMQVRGTSVAPQPDAPWGSGARQEPRSTRQHADYLHVTRQAPQGLRLPKPLKRGHPTRRASTGGGGLPQTHPAALRSGCEWGSKPLSSDIHSTPKHERKGCKFGPPSLSSTSLTPQAANHCLLTTWQSSLSGSAGVLLW